MMNKPKAVQLLIPNGKPNSIKKYKIIGWTGECLVIPRQSLKDLKEQKEINQPGLYFLFGSDDESTSSLVYIGESENFYSRITSHDTNKDFWEVAVVFFGELNRAHVKYLEYRATTLAHEVNRMKVQNKVQPQKNMLSEFEKISVDQYFEEVQFLLSVLNYDIFETVEKSIIDHTTYYLKMDGTDAKAKVLDNGGMVVFAGSYARVYETDSFGGWSKAARKEFLEKGILKLSDNKESYIFIEDVEFKSPSAAAATCAGRPANGWTTWKDANGNTLDQNLRS